MAGAYLGLADGAVQGVVLLVVEQAEVQRAQGSCGRGLWSRTGHTVGSLPCPCVVGQGTRSAHQPSTYCTQSLHPAS